MSAQKKPTGSLPVEEYAEQNGMTPQDVIEKIREGIFVGQIIEGKWYIEPASTVNPESNNESHTPVCTVISLGLAVIIILLLCRSFLTICAYDVFGLADALSPIIILLPLSVVLSLIGMYRKEKLFVLRYVSLLISLLIMALFILCFF